MVIALAIGIVIAQPFKGLHQPHILLAEGGVGCFEAGDALD
jgi:hypothetical protein